MESSENIVIYLDSLCRVIICERINERCTDDRLVAKNPLIIHMQAGNGQIGVQFYPVIFREFLADKDSPTIFTANKNNITIFDDMVIDLKLVSQYKQIFAPLPPQQQFKAEGFTPLQQNGQLSQTSKNPNIINLFDK